MKQTHLVVRLSSLCLASLLLFTAVWGRVGTAAHEPVRKATASQKGTKSAQTPAQATLSTAQFEAVVTPATIFDFAQTAYLLPPPILTLFLLLIAPLLRRQVIPYHYFGYFRHVFGHHIAPNAP